MQGELQVDPQMLRQAAGDTRRTMDGVPRDHFDDVMDNMRGDVEAVGDAQFASTLTDFCGRWRAGIGYMIDDGNEMADRLEAIAEDYEETERNSGGFFDRLLGGLR